jgi:hypothetical protein
VLHAIGKALESPLNAVNELVAKLSSFTPGGEVAVWAVVAALVLLACGVLASMGARRSLADPAGAVSGAAATSQLSARDLEREAAAAERLGLHADALRLRFRAGLMLLAERDLVRIAPTMPNAEVSRALRSERFDRLARRFDEIAYGGHQAVAEDVDVARREWRELLRSGGSV